MGTTKRWMVVAAALFGLVGACGSAPPSQDGGPPPTSSAAPGGHAHAAPPPPAPLREGERFAQVSLARPYRPAPPEGGTDEYRCFLADPGFTDTTFIIGNQFEPQNHDIVHHALLYSIDPDTVEHAKSVDAAAPGDGWQCFGGTGLGNGLDRFGGGRSDGTFIGGWAPGNAETLIGERTGYRVQAGGQIVLQVHYNLLATNGKPGPEDKSGLRLRVMPGSADVTPLSGTLLPAPIELPCTGTESGPLCEREAAIQDLVKRTGQQAKAMVDGLNRLCNRGRAPVAGDTQHCDIPVPQAATLHAIGPHMHLLGRSISVELNPGTPTAQTLLSQPAFNFDDQSTQVLPEPVDLKRGDTIRVTCTHDAGQRTRLPQLRQLKPRYVVWGDGTSDEMCLAILVTTPPGA